MNDFEKLQIRKIQIKELEAKIKSLSMEIGMLQSEKAELEDIIKSNPDKQKLKSLIDSNKALRKINRRLSKSNSDLVIKLNKKALIEKGETSEAIRGGGITAEFDYDSAVLKK